MHLNDCRFIIGKAPIIGEENHPNCHCYYEDIPPITAKAEVSIIKFTGYIFNPKYDDGKLEMFLSWGYSIEDSLYLKEEFERQAKQKYYTGEVMTALDEDLEVIPDDADN